MQPPKRTAKHINMHKLYCLYYSGFLHLPNVELKLIWMSFFVALANPTYSIVINTARWTSFYPDYLRIHCCDNISQFVAAFSTE